MTLTVKQVSETVTLNTLKASHYGGPKCEILQDIRLQDIRCKI